MNELKAKLLPLKKSLAKHMGAFFHSDDPLEAMRILVITKNILRILRGKK